MFLISSRSEPLPACAVAVSRVANICVYGRICTKLMAFSQLFGRKTRLFAQTRSHGLFGRRWQKNPQSLRIQASGWQFATPLYMTFKKEPTYVVT